MSSNLPDNTMQKAIRITSAETPQIITIADLPEFNERNTVAIGVFDGVHLGHQEIFKTAIQTGFELDSHTLALTFDPHPVQTIDPGIKINILTAPKLKEELILKTGMEKVLFLSFNNSLRHMEAEAFIEKILLEKLRAVAIVVGEDFRFGKFAKGNIDLLRNYIGKGFEAVKPVGLYKDRSGPIRSTRVRNAILEGDLSTAQALMGRNLIISGKVVHGFGRGGDVLSFPTANIKTPELASIPANGVYAAYLLVGADKLPAAVNVGTSPTFDDTNPRKEVQAHVIGHDSNLYDKAVELEFIARIRDEIKFNSVDELREAIGKDVKKVTETLQAYQDRDRGVDK